MSTNRREFLKEGLASGVCLASAVYVSAGEIDPEVAAELARRKKFLSPPDGTPPGLETRPSPPVTPFKDPLFVPPVAKPVFDVTQPGLSSEDRWIEFKKKFIEATDEYRDGGVDIGGLPIPQAHQRFFLPRPVIYGP